MKKTISLVLVMVLVLSFASSAFARATVSVSYSANPSTRTGYYDVYGTASGSGSTTVKVEITSVGFSRNGSGTYYASAGGSVQLTKGTTYTIKVTGTSDGVSGSRNFSYTAN